MKLCIRVTYDVDTLTIQHIRDRAWMKGISIEEAALVLYEEGDIDNCSDKRTAEILSFDDDGFYNGHLCLYASITTKDCHSCPVTNCPHSGHSDKEHFEGIAKSIEYNDDFWKRLRNSADFSGSSKFDYDDEDYDDEEYNDEDDYDEYEDDDYDDRQHFVQQRQLQYQQEEFQKQQLDIQRKQIEAQKEVSRNAIRSQIAALEAELATLGQPFFRRESDAERTARTNRRVVVQNQINALRAQLNSIK